MKAYEVNGCNVYGSIVFSGVVLAKDAESVSDALKRKFGERSLYCDTHPNKERQELYVEEINPYTVKINELTLGELGLFLEEMKK